MDGSINEVNITKKKQRENKNQKSLANGNVKNRFGNSS